MPNSYFPLFLPILIYFVPSFFFVLILHPFSRVARLHRPLEVGFAVSDGTFQHVLFAYSIPTFKGGPHVNYIVEQIVKNLITVTSKKNKATAIKLPMINERMWIFVNALIENPVYDSQTKETMTLLSSNLAQSPVFWKSL